MSDEFANMMLRNNSRHRQWLIILGLIDAFVVGVAVGIFYFHWQASATLCFGVPCDRFNIRVWAIENTIRQMDGSPRYLMIGDSITEGASLPDICGRKPINAGIVGATVETFQQLGRHLADLAQPDFIIVALGTNDAIGHGASGFKSGLIALINSLNMWRIIAVTLPTGSGVKDVAQFNATIEGLQIAKTKELDHVETTDGVHLTVASYVVWKGSIVSAASKAICP